MRSVLPAILLVTISWQAQAQELPRWFSPEPAPEIEFGRPDSVSEPAPHVGWTVLGAGLGGAVGGFGLGLVAFYLGGGDEIVGDDPAGLVPGILGFLVGETVGVAVGAHVGNRSRGNMGYTLLGSVGGLLVGSQIGGHLGDAGVPVGATIQLGLTVLAERLSSP